MQRDLDALAAREYDLVVVGGGIFGICAAWDAVLRGLSVALLERGDFAHAASANCFKIVHGGIRYLQHADVVRARQSTRERTALLRVAPHQVKPLPIVVPTYGHGVRGRAALGTAMKLYDLLTLDRNRDLADPGRQVPPTGLLSRREVQGLFPGLEPRGLTGAALFHDGQMESPGRLALCFLLAAAEHGVDAANYAEVTRFLDRGARVIGVVVRDGLGTQELEIRGKVVLNAAGGWAGGLLSRSLGCALDPRPTFSRDACFLTRRRFSEHHALAVAGRTRDPDAVLSRNARHLFLVPWRGSTLVGVWHVVYQGDPDRARVTEADLRGFLAELNEAYPGFEVGPEDVALTQCGLVLFGENRPGATDLSYGKRSRLVDHARSDGKQGLITLIGVRYTTARSEAMRAVDLVFEKLGRRAPPSRTGTTPVYGGAIDRVEAFTRTARRERPEGLSAASLESLLRDHGSEYGRVLRRIAEDPAAAEPLGSTPVVKAQVIQAVREEMARRLADVVFRRTELGSGGHPGMDALHAAAELMAAELGWAPSRRQTELDQVLGQFPGPPAAARSPVAGEA